MDCQRACVKLSGAIEPKGARRQATWNGACSHPSFQPSPGCKMLGAVERKKIVFSYKGNYHVMLMNMISM